MAVVSMKQLLEAGVHFGHQTRRWNPKMAPYIYTERNGIYIIDLQKTVKKLEEAYNFVRTLAENGQTILFVGTKKQAADAVKEEASRVIKRANEEAILEKKRAMDEMKQEVIGIASMMAQKVVSASIDTTIQDTLVEETLKEMGDSTWQN